VGNVSQDLDAWLVSHVEEKSSRPESSQSNAGDPSDEKENLEAQLAFLVPDPAPAEASISRRASEPEPEARFCDEVILGTAVHRAKAHFKAMVASVLALSGGLALVAGYEVNHHFGSTTASFQAPVPTASLRSGLGLTGTYVADPSGQFPMMLSLRQDQRELFGLLTTSRLDQTSSPESVMQDSVKLTGFVTRSGFEIVIHSKPTRTVGGSISGTSLTLQISGSAILFVKGAGAGFNTLLERESSFVLDQSDQASDRAAVWDLAVATNKAEGYGFVSRGDFSHIQEFGAFTTGLRWTAGSCETAKCVSYRVVDVENAKDNRGAVLATFSPASAACYYSAVLMANPVGVSNDGAAFANVNSSVTRSGTYFARTKSASCSASNVLGSAANVSWTTSLP
jgi:hypothetical protein